MPLYTFSCECGRKRDEIQSLSVRTEFIKCECGKDAKRVSVYATSFALKGGGWYKDGYVKKGK
jgi:putative FmdB family regulatory protein